MLWSASSSATAPRSTGSSSITPWMLSGATASTSASPRGGGTERGGGRTGPRRAVARGAGVRRRRTRARAARRGRRRPGGSLARRAPARGRGDLYGERRGADPAEAARGAALARGRHGGHASGGAATPLYRHPLPVERGGRRCRRDRSEEHTSELQSRLHLVCRLLLEKKKKKKHNTVRR